MVQYSTVQRKGFWNLEGHRRTRELSGQLPCKNSSDLQLSSFAILEESQPKIKA